MADPGQSTASDHFTVMREEDSETCLKHPDRKPIAYSVMCRECYDHERQFAEAAMRLLEAVERHEFSSVNARTWADVSDAMIRLRGIYDEA